jgi:NAD(P)-dependent dehydrogenase (short-subunit alcohol dehydrogenase family)
VDVVQFAALRTVDDGTLTRAVRREFVLRITQESRQIMKIDGSTFFITGGGSGLGAGCARRFAAAGGKILIADVQEEAGKKLAAELGTGVQFARTDVTDEASVKAALAQAQRAFGGVQVVINCAGIIGVGRVVGKEGPYDLASFSRTVQVNLIGTFNVIRLAAAMMAGQAPSADNERGVIINTASVAAFEGQVGQAAYSASKGGVVSMTLPIARELARFGIRVLTIAPGVFQTAMMAGMPQPQQEALESQVPFPSRLGQPDEFAALAEHMVENVMLNGTTVRLDGALRLNVK